MTIEQMVFIGGCARSGTTLLGSMLGVHPECICVPESQFKAPLLKDPSLHDSTDIHRLIAEDWRFKLWDMPVAPDELALNGSAADRPARTMLRLVELYAAKVDKPGARVWIDHTPHNVRQAKLLARAFRNSKFIHIVRDGRAVAASVMPLDWGPNSIMEAAHFWVEQTAYGLAAEQQFGKERVRRVHYERLVREPEAVMREVSGFLGLDFVPGMTEGGGFVVPQYSVGQHQLVARRPDPSRIDAWMSILTPREHEIFEHLTEDFLDYMGYERRCPYPTTGPSTAEKATIKARSLVRKHLGNRARSLFRRASKKGTV